MGAKRSPKSFRGFVDPPPPPGGVGRAHRPAFKLDEEELYIVFAAMCSMVEDIHAPQDRLTEEQWEQSEQLYSRIVKRIEDLT